MTPAQFGSILRNGLATGDFNALLTVRKKADFDNLLYAINQLHFDGHTGFTVKMRELTKPRSDEHRYNLWVVAEGDTQDGRPHFACKTVTDLRGFLIGLLVSKFTSSRAWLALNSKSAA